MYKLCTPCDVQMLAADNHAYFASEAQQLFTFLSQDPDNLGLGELQLADSGKQMCYLLLVTCCLLRFKMTVRVRRADPSCSTWSAGMTPELAKNDYFSGAAPSRNMKLL
jgi:hypothetical protein